jgi:hypothetical protein
MGNTIFTPDGFIQAPYYSATNSNDNSSTPNWDGNKYNFKIEQYSANILQVEESGVYKIDCSAGLRALGSTGINLYAGSNPAALSLVRDTNSRNSGSQWIQYGVNFSVSLNAGDYFELRNYGSSAIWDGNNLYDNITVERIGV